MQLGGSEFKGEALDEYTKKDKDEKVQYRLPFGGGSGAAVSINPVAFLIVEKEKVKLMPVTHSSCIDKILDYVPDLFDKINQSIDKFNDKTEEKYKKIKINKTPTTTEEPLKYNKKKEEDKEIEQDLEELFDDEFNDD